jgi:predicted ATP-grasp superfamily ATP-dependent carboligase
LLQDPHGYLQQFVEGQVFGAALNVRWAGNDDGPEIEMLGTTAAWSSAQWPAAGEFTYRGGYGPIELSPSDQDAILSFAKHLCQRCPGQYKGWLQVDFIRSNEGHLYLLEVNPRWTSSMEILVRSQLVNPCIQHAAAWGLDIDPQAQRKRSAIALFGKAIVYASSDLVLTQNYLQHLHHLPRQHYADLPSNNYKGQVIPSGHPLLTVIDSVPLGTNAPAESLLKQLRNLASRVL